MLNGKHLCMAILKIIIVFNLLNGGLSAWCPGVSMRRAKRLMVRGHVTCPNPVAPCAPHSLSKSRLSTTFKTSSATLPSIIQAILFLCVERSVKMSLRMVSVSHMSPNFFGVLIDTIILYSFVYVYFVDVNN